MKHIFKNRGLLVLVMMISMINILSGQVNFSGTTLSGISPSAIGFQTSATGDYSFSAGYMSEATQGTAIALGWKSLAYGVKSLALGESCQSASQGYSFGQGAKALGSQSMALGRYVETTLTGMNSIVIGAGSSSTILKNNIPNSLMIGLYSTVPTVFIGMSASTSGIGKVGIGTTNPVARFQVADGDVFIQDIDRGIIMKSPDGKCWRGTMDNTGQLIFVLLPDCESTVTSTANEPETNALQIFPNPGTDRLFVNNPYPKAILTITDMSGIKVLTNAFEAGELLIDSREFAAGTYLITLKADNGKVLSQKWIKQ